MKTEAEIRQKLKDAQDARDALNRAIGGKYPQEATGITQILMGPMITVLKWVLNDDSVTNIIKKTP